MSDSAGPLRAIETFALELHYPPLVSLETYAIIGEIRDLLIRGRNTGFHGRVFIRTVDDRARAWASCAPGARETGVARSGGRGDFATDAIVERLRERDRVETVAPEITFYLRTLVQILHALAGRHSALWEATATHWRDERGTVPVRDVEDVAGPFRLMPITLRAATEVDLRDAFEHAMVEAVSPW